MTGDGRRRATDTGHETSSHLGRAVRPRDTIRPLHQGDASWQSRKHFGLAFRVRGLGQGLTSESQPDEADADSRKVA